eukprot:m.259139 g.259139  ORF g.259139 m.259139 type:complete len:298 (-) comp37610_c0_seq1:133-1026(-)
MNERGYYDRHESLKPGWFSEISDLWPGQCMSLKIKSKLFDDRSAYQHVQVFETECHGKMLCLDGVIQTTDLDEFSYQEMMTHTPMCSHPNPETVAVIGAGDGGILREVCKHASVKHVDHCEIDKMVCDVSKKYLPNLSSGLSDARVTTQYADGAKWLAQNPSKYDVIIVDSSDPVGPAATLFEETFYKTMKSALKPGGIICAQGECQWSAQNVELIVNIQTYCAKLFKNARYGFTTVPTYPFGQIGFVVCSDDATCVEPVRRLPATIEEDLNYYTSEMHKAAFVLPNFMLKKLKKAL